VSRLVRFGVLLMTATTVAIGLTGCSFLEAKPVPTPASTAEAVSAECLVGTWHQSEGWQRLNIDTDTPMEIRLISGGRDLTIAANGTATMVYTTPAVWHGDNGPDELSATFSGSSTLTYTAKDGAWSEVADNTKVVTVITLNGTKDTPRNGSAGRTFEAKYRCSDTDLVIAADDYRQVFKRA
jgi:hypothetical protein